MTQIVETHITKRGVFGWLFLVLFWIFNALMALWGWSALTAIGHQYAGAAGPNIEFEHAGTAIGGAIGGAFILLVWVSGTVILGLLALLTRGRKTLIVQNTNGKA